MVASPGSARVQFSYRALHLLVHLLVGLVIAVALQCSFGRLRPEPLARWWSARLLAVFNISLRCRGSALGRARLSVANHISWLDIPLISASQDTRFVSKSEVRDWPVAGWLANAAGSFYIRRGRGGAAPLLKRLCPHLERGGSVVIFPEGTTTAGEQPGLFHPRLFAAAIAAECPVQPIAIRYGRASNGEHIAPFIGDTTLAGHILRLLREPALRAEIFYCAPIPSRGLDRNTLAEAARASINQALRNADTEYAAEEHGVAVAA